MLRQSGVWADLDVPANRVPFTLTHAGPALAEQIEPEED
jgi:hypothetical protein